MECRDSIPISRRRSVEENHTSFNIVRNQTQIGQLKDLSRKHSMLSTYRGSARGIAGIDVRSIATWEEHHRKGRYYSLTAGCRPGDVYSVPAPSPAIDILNWLGDIEMDIRRSNVTHHSSCFVDQRMGEMHHGARGLDVEKSGRLLYQAASAKACRTTLCWRRHHVPAARAAMLLIESAIDTSFARAES